MGWHSYRTAYQIVKALAKKQGREFLAQDWVEFYKMTAHVNADTPSLLANLFEPVWIKSNKPTVFVDSTIVADILANSKYSDFDAAESYSGVIFPNTPVYSIVFEESTRVSGHAIPPFLFGHIKKQVMQIVMKSRSINYGSYACLAKDRVGNSMSIWCGDEPQYVIGKIEDTQYGEGTLSPNESELLASLFRLAFRLEVYCKAFPQSVRDGVPSKMNAYSVKQISAIHSRCISVPDKYKNTPAAHFRSGHFRCLGDRRFKHNPDGTARVIYINPCLVGEKLEAKTVS